MTGKAMKKIKDFATGKAVALSPEESVRQEYERILAEDYGYGKSEMDIEVQIPRGRGYFPDRADIVVFKSSSGRDPASDILGIVEVKRPHRREGLDQLKSYMTAASAVWGVWTNGDDIAYVCRPPGKSAVSEDYLNNIPVKGQSIQNVGRLKKQDLKPFGRPELKSAFRRILRKLYANTNISRREKLGGEMIKLIFAKLEDEKTYANRDPDFRAEAGESPEAAKNRISGLFERVKEELKNDGVFSYIRVADIVNWELYRNPVSGVPLEVYQKMTKNKKKLKARDILFVRRGSFRIGTVAMASPRDREVLLTRELLTFRVLKEKNPYGISAFYLLWLLSSEFVQKQLQSKIFVDTTLPNIGSRWKELLLLSIRIRQKRGRSARWQNRRLRKSGGRRLISKN